ncbi:MAG: quinone-dependent dihydroorotate dehydrogenase [Moraxellaceae bacterium]|nr:quinone-dependent dihydroorotate dehydrogenase [Moraxellaceae bacterium]MBS9779163.1 quinone-dependent dihydroorotate dehydrogenase [Moraxellaceae bacterium]
MSYTLLRPLLFSLEPEHAHEVTLSLLAIVQKIGLMGFVTSKQSLKTHCMGMDFINPVGLGAGLDKNADYIDALGELGFGFIEVGTVTPKPQIGNPKPRLFRIPEAQAIINRMGFNNLGVEHLIENVKKSKYKGRIGINIGKNAVTPVENAVDDYLYCLERVYPHASYITVNISSPNTKNLRDLQSGDALTNLLSDIKDKHSQLATSYGFYVPLVLKVAPDLDNSQIEFISKQLVDFEIDGLITTNTTISRTAVNGLPNAEQAGGLSGRPVNEMSTLVLKQFADILQDKVTIIGVGGIDSGEKAIKKMQTGASLIQIYSGLIYKGPRLVEECVTSLDHYFEMLKQTDKKLVEQS